MILGIGTDLCNINRIESVLNKFGPRFLAKLFGEEELQAITARPPQLQPATIAKRFAAKEACAKALGTGIAAGINFKDLIVVSDGNGKPRLRLTGGAALRLQTLTPPGLTAQVDVSLSDDHPMALAFVVISARRLPA